MDFKTQTAAEDAYNVCRERQAQHTPRSDVDLIMPFSDLVSIIKGIRDDLEQMSLAKAERILDYARDVRRNDRGMQSVDLDPYQVQHFSEYFERPSYLTFENMRAMVQQTPILESIVLTRTRQVMRFCKVQESGHGLGFVIRHVDKDHALSRSEQEMIDLLQRFMMNCGWEFRPRERKRLKRTNFATFMARSVRDSLILDSAPIETEMKRDKALGIDGFYAVDGATIRLVPETGFRGDEDIFALQVIQGKIMTAYTLDDLIYEPRNPRTDVDLAGYGMSEVELLVKIVTGFLNALQLNLRGFSENSIPKGFINLIGDYTQDDLASFRRYWNSMVSGANSSWSLPVLVAKDPNAKATFERFGIDFDEMYFSKWMTFLTSIACAVYGISPDEINFESFSVGRSPLSGSDTAEKLSNSKDKGLRPLLAYYESLFSDYIISNFGEQYCFRWTGIDDDDESQRYEIRKMVMTVNEARAREGMELIDGPLGEAPLNPSLIHPWLQIQNQSDNSADNNKMDGDDGHDDEQGNTDNEKNGAPERFDRDEADGHEQGTAGKVETSETDPEKENLQKSDLYESLPMIYRLGDY